MTTQDLQDKLKWIEEQMLSYEDAKQEIAQELYRKTYVEPYQQSQQPKHNLFEKYNRLENLAKILAKTWFYGEFKAETPNEMVMQMIMEDLGLYEFEREDDMIAATQVDDNLYKQARERAEKSTITKIKREWHDWLDDGLHEGQYPLVVMENFLSYIDSKYIVAEKEEKTSL